MVIADAVFRDYLDQTGGLMKMGLYNLKADAPYRFLSEYGRTECRARRGEDRVC